MGLEQGNGPRLIPPIVTVSTAIPHIPRVSAFGAKWTSIKVRYRPISDLPRRPCKEPALLEAIDPRSGHPAATRTSSSIPATTYDLTI